MDQEDFTKFQRLDPLGMIGHIHHLPGRLEAAWAQGQHLPLPAWDAPRGVVLAGMGASALAADLLAAYLAPLCPVPMLVWRDYDLPGWARGPETLVVAISHSGDTEETLSACQAAHQAGCRVLALTGGGALAGFNGGPLWQLSADGASRAALGEVFGLLLAAFTRLGLLADPTEEVNEALHALRNQQTNLHHHVPTVLNPAKRLAGQMVGRLITVFGADLLAPVARRWKDQINANAKTWALCDALPETDHNTLAGLENPEGPLHNLMTIFLHSAYNHPRNRLRLEWTQQAFMLQGINTDFYHARGETRLGQLWTALHFGDYVSYFLAINYGADPTPVEALTLLKTELGNS